MIYSSYLEETKEQHFKGHASATKRTNMKVVNELQIVNEKSKFVQLLLAAQLDEVCGRAAHTHTQ